MERRWRLVMTFLAVVGSTACGNLRELPTDPGGGGGTPDPTATFSRVQAEIFTPTCARSACHDSFAQQSGLVLAPGVAYANTVNQPSLEVGSIDRVEPGDPTNSYLYRKVVGGNGIIGDRMPSGLPPLSDAQVTLLRDWIRRGAPND